MKKGFIVMTLILLLILSYNLCFTSLAEAVRTKVVVICKGTGIVKVDTPYHKGRTAFFRGENIYGIDSRIVEIEDNGIKQFTIYVLDERKTTISWKGDMRIDLYYSFFSMYLNYYHFKFEGKNGCIEFDTDDLLDIGKPRGGEGNAVVIKGDNESPIAQSYSKSEGSCFIGTL